MNLRRATLSDAVAIAALEQQVFGQEAWSGSSLVAELSGHDRFAVVATENEEVTGYAITLRAADVVDLLRLGVSPGHRRRGLATALLAAAVARARADGADRLLLEVGARNYAALAFYAREGLVEIDRRANYYRDGSDAVVLEWTL